MVPLSVNGSGWREASYIVLFQSVGATAEQAAALALLWLGAVVVTSLPGGIIYVVRGARKEDKTPDSEDFLSQSDLPEATPPSTLPGEEETVSTV
jgi:uncharacterized membrane protein YbhN (UPF0104 family)